MKRNQGNGVDIYLQFSQESYTILHIRVVSEIHSTNVGICVEHLSLLSRCNTEIERKSLMA